MFDYNQIIYLKSLYILLLNFLVLKELNLGFYLKNL